MKASLKWGPLPPNKIAEQVREEEGMKEGKGWGRIYEFIMFVISANKLN